MKKILGFLILSISVFLFSGCASVQHLRTYESEGAIIDKFVVELDSDFELIVKNAEKRTTIKNSIRAEFSKFEEVYDEWKAQFIVDTTLFTKINNGIQLENKNYTKQNGVIVYELTLFFKSKDLFEFFYSDNSTYNVGAFSHLVTGGERGEVEVEPLNDFLLAYDLQKDNSILPFAALVKSENNKSMSLYNYYYELGRGTVAPTELDFSGISISQIFSTNIERLYANADDTITENGYTSFYWDLTNKNADFVLKVYNVRPNSTSWYYLGLGISLAIVVVLLYIHFKDKGSSEKIVKLENKKVSFTKKYLDEKKKGRFGNNEINVDVIKIDDIDDDE